MRKNWFFLLFLVLCSALMTSSAWAQAGGDDDCHDAAGGSIPCSDNGDADNSDGGSSHVGDDVDGDGTVDSLDQCPAAGGPASLNGCPDNDNDGTSDNLDRCPTVGGPAANAGCPGDPVSEPTLVEPTARVPAALLAALPPGGTCVVGTLRNAPVNLRADADTSSPVVGQLQPGTPVAVLYKLTKGNDVWYLTAQGWVSGAVVQLGGDCADIPQVIQGHIGTANGGEWILGVNNDGATADPEYDPSKDCTYFPKTKTIACCKTVNGQSECTVSKIKVATKKNTSGGVFQCDDEVQRCVGVIVSLADTPDGGPECTDAMLAERTGRTRNELLSPFGLTAVEPPALPDPLPEPPTNLTAAFDPLDGDPTAPPGQLPLGASDPCEIEVRLVATDKLTGPVPGGDPLPFPNGTSFRIVLPPAKPGTLPDFSPADWGIQCGQVAHVVHCAANLGDLTIDVSPDEVRGEHILLARQVGVPPI